MGVQDNKTTALARAMTGKRALFTPDAVAFLLAACQSVQFLVQFRSCQTAGAQAKQRLSICKGGQSHGDIYRQTDGQSRD